MRTPKKAVLEPLRVRVRRLQFIVGLGFLALVVGSVLSSALTMRLIGRVDALSLTVLRFAIALGLQNLWVLVVLPLLCYGAARVVELRPWSTALGAAFTGQLFLLALEFVQAGVDGWVERGWLLTALQWGVFAGGVVLSQRAVVRGRAAAGLRAEQARQQADARKDEYAEFLREAERAGEKSVQRETPKSETQAGEQAVAPAAPGAETPEQRPEDRPDDVPKAPSV
ncbi:hypothetical protein JQX13_32780 [Archangium violaceum]|uniref:hypothetical protein n=1 Tax=Archangium violaceum TaxID=83451 RepID=UPI00193BB70D|nr:hypothetical protein [Archangium violaceum]QRK04966.1 hypothetical protein JQX13_32780 [Archangium violaceum]